VSRYYLVNYLTRLKSVKYFTRQVCCGGIFNDEFIAELSLKIRGKKKKLKISRPNDEVAAHKVYGTTLALFSLTAAIGADFFAPPSRKRNESASVSDRKVKFLF